METKRIMKLGGVLLVAAVAQATFTPGLNSSSLTTLITRVPQCAVGSSKYQNRKRRRSDPQLSNYRWHASSTGTTPPTAPLTMCTAVMRLQRPNRSPGATVNVTQELCNGYPNEPRARPAKFLSVGLPTMTLVVVLLRCATQIHVSRRLWWDDGAALLAMALLAVISVLGYANEDMGFGHHYWNIDPGNSKTILQIIYVLQMLYIFVQAFAKISIACFYSRVFASKTFRLKTNIFMIFLTTRSLLFLLLIIFQCTPIQSIWNRAIPSQCLNISAISNGGAAFSIFEDMILITLPISELPKLQLDRKKKAALFGMFALGSLRTSACIGSMIRLKYMVTFAHSFDPTWDYVDVADWSSLELNAAVMCGSLPALRPLFIKARTLVSAIKLSSGSGVPTSTSGKLDQHQQRHGFAMGNIAPRPSRSHQASGQSWPADADTNHKPIRLDSLKIESAASDSKSAHYCRETAIKSSGSDLDSGQWSAGASSAAFDGEQMKSPIESLEKAFTANEWIAAGNELVLEKQAHFFMLG
ncbi:integral membrane protein [Colletotrichum salicis]|uniref:Integral membrane protein n=1 Tax=Colletotrichum salicis TaxID=1209931 RepID=A0A135S0P7_9PEZI|nr:integral membrane protein [Colletotrichum salicis]